MPSTNHAATNAATNHAATNAATNHDASNHTATNAATNHAATMAGLFADTVTIDWSDGFKSDGPAAAIFERFSSTWGAMVSTMCYAPDVLVDTTNSKVLTTGQAVINVDGGFPEANLVQNKLGHLLTLDESGKVSSWVGLWDNEYPPMLAALAKVMEKMTASN